MCVKHTPSRRTSGHPAEIQARRGAGAGARARAWQDQQLGREGQEDTLPPPGGGPTAPLFGALGRVARGAASIVGAPGQRSGPRQLALAAAARVRREVADLACSYGDAEPQGNSGTE